MDKQLQHFLNTYRMFSVHPHRRTGLDSANEQRAEIIRAVDCLYRHFGPEYIHNLPSTLHTVDQLNQFYQLNILHIPDHILPGCLGYYTEQGNISGVLHNVTGPAYRVVFKNNRELVFYYILDVELTLDEWLPRSALSPEEQTMYKLKHG